MERRKLIILAVSAPIITALVMGSLIIRKALSGPGQESPRVVESADARGDALARLATADLLPPDEMVRAADEADRAAGSPLVEACLVRAQAARKRRDPAAERAAVAKALSIDPSRPEAQLASALAAAESWARDAAPTARVHAPDTGLATPLLVPPSPPLEPGLDKFEGRARDIARLLVLLGSGGKPEEIAPLWATLSAGTIEDRLAFAMGIHSLRLGAPRDALVWMRIALSAVPDDPSRLRCGALAALLSSESAEALEFIRRWSAGGGRPTPAEALGWWAVAARRLGDIGVARQKLDEAAALDPAWRGARGWLAYHGGDRKQALEDAVERKESDPWARYLRALLHWEDGEVDAALAESSTLLQGWPDHYEALVLQARGLTARGRNEKAEELWKHAQKFAAGRTDAKLGLAEFYATTGRREDAISAFLEIQGVAVAHWRATQLMFELNRTAEALRWGELGVQRYPHDARLMVTLGKILHARLDHFGERLQLERAVQLAPDHAEAKKLLAECIDEMRRD